ncbi:MULTISPECIES: myo-inosose-2 dehydratase [unclassified Mesorhizobium]|uniref:myo-inosose-2 dehydratase n=1 Tax=unclassified Mesorhizobium TaxID=325217 RepID=UPI0003CEF6E6|nr:MULTISPECIES: myo-inosose-2 dehydratase [unclassified Mesorhizobium]ESY57920.1 xylose isomerase [Mesorhizobium sp. LNJC374B00]ESY60617.1 xylose isomerase [Mesorhizobium sp. LNJC372A00]WJI83866.1 myo-inosose-2 dehydratase [Mesorhizobium sp. C374B]WJI84655.1 myo-inosose-2 dehydratase [Mesorhizobium sp. C372A]
MTVKIGINPITWSNDDVPALGGDTPLATCLSETRQAGYRGTELGGKFPRRSDELGPILSSYGLELVSGWYDGRILDRTVDEEFAALTSHLILLRDLGAKVVVYADTSRGRHDGIFAPISQRPRLADGEWTAYGEKLTELADRMAAFGVGMAFHHHMGTIVESDDEVDRLMAATGKSVGLLFDTGHCLFSGGDPASLLNRHLDRIVHFHCKDVRAAVLEKARREDMSFMAAVMEGIFTVPGDGSVDFLSLLQPLASHGFEGWIVVEAEQDPAKAHPLTYATKGYASLLKTACAAGFDVAIRDMA